MKRLIIFILLLIVIALSLACFYYKIDMENYLVLTEKVSGKKEIIPVPQARFQISYTHSVHKTPVEEFFYIAEDNKMVLYEIRYSSYGVGMPYDFEGGVFSNQDGQFHLTGLQREFPAIDIMASEIPAQVIIVEGRKYHLLTLFQPDKNIHISAAKRLRLVRKGS